MSQKHKRRPEEEKHSSSRSNVFERLGETKKERGNWQLQPSHKRSSSQRSNVERYEGAHVPGRHGERMMEQWSSSSRERPIPQSSPSKVAKSKRIDNEYIDNYKQDRRRYDEEVLPSKHMHPMEELPPKKHQQSAELMRNDIERKRKRKPKSPVSSNGSSISPVRSKHEPQRSKYRSPSPLQQAPKEKEQRRGRSKERKTKKLKEIVKVKEQLKPAKPTKSYEQYTDSSDYKASMHEHQYKVMRDSDNYEQEKYRKETHFEYYKEKKRTSDGPASVHKKTRVPARQVSQPPIDEESYKYRDSSTKSNKHRLKAPKSEPVYESDDVVPAPRKKTKSKTSTLMSDESKKKKKAKVEKEDRDVIYSEKSSTSDYGTRVKTKKSKNDDYFEEIRLSQHAVPSKHKESKYTGYGNISEVDSGEERERKLKIKKKKKQIVEDTREPVKKRKKLKIEEQPKKRNPKIYEEEMKDKPKVIKKKKRPREPSTSSSPTSSSSSSSSESDSESGNEIRSKKHSARDSWEIPNVAEAAPEQAYMKRSSYGSTKARSSSMDPEPKRKRTKMEMRPRESPENESSVNNSGYRQTPPATSQYNKRQDERPYERQAYPAYDVIKEPKPVRDDDARGDRRVHGADVQQKRVERHPEYIDAKEERTMGRYDRSPASVQYKSLPEDKKGYYDKNYSRYDEKPINSSYEEKRGFGRRDQGFHEKKIHYDERRDGRGDSYPVNDRKQRESYLPSHDAPHQHPSRHKPAVYPHEGRPGDMRSAKESRHPDWQMERVKKHKDPAPGYSGGMQRNASWMDGRDGSKMRVDTRDPGYRGNRDPPHVDERNYRVGRNDPRDPRDTRPAQHEVRGRADTREHPPMRAAPRKPQADKWAPERLPYDSNEMRRSGGRYNEDRHRAQEAPFRYKEEQASPSFHREVRRSETRNDLKIEVTIGGRNGPEFDRNRNTKRSPLRKVSSYEVMKNRERAVGKIQAERNPSRDRGSSENLRYKRPVSPLHGKPVSNKYPQYGTREFSGGSHDNNFDNRDYARRQLDSKQQDAIRLRKKDDKYYKKEAPRSATESDRSRDSSAVDRVRSRDSSTVGRDKSGDQSRPGSRSRKDASHLETRTESSHRKSSKTSQSHKDSEREASERRKKSSVKVKSPVKKSKEKHTEQDGKSENKEKAEAAGVLDIDWTSVSSEKQAASQLDSGSILNRFTPGNVLLRMGVSTKLLPPHLLEDVKKKCEEEGVITGNSPLVLNQELGALNRTAHLRQLSWSNAFSSNPSPITSYADAEYRKNILSITQDMLYPSQPPVIINAKSYASSIKHYLTKTKLSVGA